MAYSQLLSWRKRALVFQLDQKDNQSRPKFHVKNVSPVTPNPGFYIVEVAPQPRDGACRKWTCRASPGGFPSHVASAYAHPMGTVNAPGSCRPCLPSEPESGTHPAGAAHSPPRSAPCRAPWDQCRTCYQPLTGRTMFTEHGSILYPRPRAQSKKSFLSFSKKKKISE